jgi:hypothetical protein
MEAPQNNDKLKFISEVQDVLASELDNIKNGDIELDLAIQNISKKGSLISLSLRDYLVNKSGKPDTENAIYVKYKAIEYYLKKQFNQRKIKREQIEYWLVEKQFETKTINNQTFYRIVY